MAVRRRRPLVPPPYPRRNRYTPLSSEQSPLVSVSAVSLRLIAKTALAPLLLLFPSQTLRWFVMGALWGKRKVRSVRFGLRPKLTAPVVPPLPTANAALVCGGNPVGETQSPLALFSRRLSFVDLRWEHAGSKAISGLGLPWVFGRSPMEIVTHPGVGMCYNSMTFQVLVNFTISFTGVTLASSR